MAKSSNIESTTKSKMSELLEKEEYSPKTLSRSQIVEGKVVAISKDQLFIDIGAKSEGVISAKDFEGEQKFGDIKVGDKIMTYVMIPESEGGQVILSMKKAGSERRWQEISKKMEADETVEVKPLESNRGGLMVDYEGIRGFIPSSHLVTNVNKTSNEPIKVKILEEDKRLNRLIFSQKEASPDAGKLPKIDLPFSVGDDLEGEVSKMLPFGFLVRISGSEGLVHISEISWERVESIEKLYKIGDKVKVKVIEIDPASTKINLSIKQLSEDPWKKAENKYPIGKKFKAKIVRTSSYGAFVQLELGIEGLIHSSKIPYGTKLASGDEVNVSIDLFSSEQRRVALRLENEVEEKPSSRSVRLNGSALSSPSKSQVKGKSKEKKTTSSKSTKAAVKKVTKKLKK